MVKMLDKIRGANVQISPDIGRRTCYYTFTRILQMLLLDDVIFDNLLGQWSHTKLCHTFVQALNLE